MYTIITGTYLSPNGNGRFAFSSENNFKKVGDLDTAIVGNESVEVQCTFIDKKAGVAHAVLTGDVVVKSKKKGKK